MGIPSRPLTTGHELKNLTNLMVSIGFLLYPIFKARAAGSRLFGIGKV